MRNEVKWRAFVDAFEALHRAVCAFSIGDIDGEHRGDALGHLSDLRDEIDEGLKFREKERRVAEEAEVLKAWREGRVTIVEKVGA